MKGEIFVLLPSEKLVGYNYMLFTVEKNFVPLMLLLFFFCLYCVAFSSYVKSMGYRVAFIISFYVNKSFNILSCCDDFLFCFCLDSLELKFVGTKKKTFFCLLAEISYEFRLRMSLDLVGEEFLSFWLRKLVMTLHNFVIS